MSNLPFATGYCTNVHAGATLEATRANLERHALAVKERYSPDRPMGVGLWLSAKAAEELVSQAEGRDVRRVAGRAGPGALHAQRLSLRRLSSGGRQAPRL